MLRFLNRPFIRQTISGGFIFLVAFNIVGYIFVLEWCQADIQKKAEELIETHASEISGNLIFRVPVGDTYTLTPDEYVRVEGSIEFEGSTYRMVKQKLHDKLLYIVCVKENQTSIATNEINEVIAAVSGQNGKSPTKGMKVLNTLLKYCLTSEASREPGAGGWSRNCLFGDLKHIYFYDAQSSLFHPPALG